MMILLALLLAASPYLEPLGALAESSAPAPQRLHELFDLEWRRDNDEHPAQATFRGVPGGNDRLTDLSPSATAPRKAEDQSLRRATRSIDRQQLEEKDRLDYDLFLRSAEEDVALDRFPGELLATRQLGGPQY